MKFLEEISFRFTKQSYKICLFLLRVADFEAMKEIHITKKSIRKHL